MALARHSTRNGRGRTALRVMSCLAAVPIGLGPTIVAFADDTTTTTTSTETATADTATTVPPTTAAPDTTAPPTTAVPDTTAPATTTPETTAPDTTTPDTSASTTVANVPESTAPPTTIVDVSTTTGSASSVPTTTIPDGGTATTVTSDPTDTTIDPAATSTSSTTPSTTDVGPGSATTVVAATDDSTTTTSVDDTATSTASSTSSSTSTSAPPTTTASTSTTVLTPPGLPQPMTPAPANTIWSLGLRYLGGTTYTGTYDLNLRAGIGGSTVELTDGEVVGGLVRTTGVDHAVRVEMGSSYDPSFPFTWECTGDVSGLQVGTTEQFTPMVADTDASMDCVFVIDNTNPPVVNFVTEVLGDDGAIGFDYSIDYSSYDNVNVSSFSGGDGANRSANGLAGFGLRLTATPFAGNPPFIQSIGTCRDSAGGYVSAGYSGSVTATPNAMVPGAVITCTFTHTVPSTLVIIEDVVPDAPAPAADYFIFSRIVDGPSTWTLSDGQTQGFTLSPSYTGSATFTRNEVPGWDLDRVECVEGPVGSTVPYTNFLADIRSSSTRVSFPLPPAGSDIVCTFTAVPAGPPSVTVSVQPNVIDQSAYADFVVEVRDDASNLLETITAPAGGSSRTEMLPAGGTYAVTITNPQGLDVSWDCDGTTTSAATANFPTILGETSRCTLSLVEPIPTGTSTLTVAKNEDPDLFDTYQVTVTNGDFVVGSGSIYEDPTGSLEITDLAPQTLTITERSRNTSYELASVVCSDAATTSAITNTAFIDSPIDGNTIREGEFTVEIPAGTDVDCLLTNSPSTTPAILRVETVTVPAGATTSFDYAITPASSVVLSDTFSQTDGGDASRAVDGGNFMTVTQDASPDYITEVACAPTGAPLSPFDGLSSGVFVENGLDYTCRFVNTFAPASLTIGVDIEPDAATVETELSLSRIVPGFGRIDVPLDPALITGDGSSTATTLLDGEYSISLLYPLAYVASAVTGDPSCRLGGSYIEEFDGMPTWRVTEIFVSIAGGSDAACSATLTPGVAAAVSVGTFVSDDRPDTFTYTVTPAANVYGSSAFSLDTNEFARFDVLAGPNLTITQTGPAGYSTTVECFNKDTYSLGTGTTAITFSAPDQDDIFCEFFNTPIGGTNTVSLSADVSTGPVDRSDEFLFLTEVAGTGVRGPGGLGVTRTFDLADDDTRTVLVDDGTEVTVDVTDADAGVDGFEYTITCGTESAVNGAVTFTPTGDITCSVGFVARTVTVNKFVDPFGSSDEFELEVSPAIDPEETFYLRDGEQEVVVVALAGTTELSEFDYDPFDPSIVCTRVTSSGAVSPPTGPFGGDHVVVPADRASYECDVINGVAFVPAYEITLRSELDLGAVELPRDFPGVEVEFDGDLADEFEENGGNDGVDDENGEENGDDVPPIGPVDLLGRRPVSAAVAVPVVATPSNVAVAPNGTVSVFVIDGGDITIRPSTGSESFTTTLSCPGAPGVIQNLDGSLTLSGVSGATTCLMRNSAGNVTLTHSVSGPTTETSWPFSISNVVAGPSIVSLGDGDSVTVAVGVDSPTTMTQTDARGATSVSSGCGSFGITPFVEYRSLLASIIDSSESVTVTGAQAVTCSFATEYATVTPPTTVPPTTTPATTVPPTTTPATTAPPTTSAPTTTATTAPGATTTTTLPASTTSTTSPGATTTTPTTTVVPDPTAPGATTTLPPTVSTSPAPNPFATPGTIPTSPTTSGTEPPSTTVTTVTTVTPATTVPPDAPETPTTEPTGDDPSPTTVPDDPPPPIITDDPETPDIFVDIGDPIPVDIDCDGLTTILVNGVEQDRVDQIEPSTLGLGDHVIEVRCDDQTITEVRAVVFEQDEGAPAGSNMTVIVMFVVMAVGAFVFAPSAAGRKRLPV